MSGIREREAVNNVCITTRAQSFRPNKGWFELTTARSSSFQADIKQDLACFKRIAMLRVGQIRVAKNSIICENLKKNW